MADDPYASIAHDPYASIASGTTPAPASGGLDLGAIGKNIGGAVDAGARNFNAARTAAARDPVGALGNVFNAFPGAVTGGVMNPILQNTGNDIGQTLRSVGEGVLGGATNPSEADRYEKAFGDLQFHGMRPTGQDMPSRIGRGAQDFVAQTEIPGQGLPFKALAPLTKVAGKAIPAAANWVSDVAKDWTNPQVAAAARTLAKPVSKTLSGVRGVVNAGKDVLFLNPAVHGVGNLGMLNYLKNGVGTAAKGFKYGVTGTPQATRDELTRIGAEAFTPELMGKSSPWGPVGWAERLPGPTVAKAALGATAGAGVGYQTAPGDESPQDRLKRALEGGLIGATIGGAPALRTGSNRLMTRLETGHRGAMLEDMPRPDVAPNPKPHYTAAEVAAMAKRRRTPDVAGPAANPTLNRAARPSGLGQKGLFQHGMATEGPKIADDPLGAAINATFGGGKKSPGATLATAAGGPFAQWLTDIVPRNVGSAIVKHPERVAAATRVQNITNRDVLNDQPYKLQMGGPIGDMAEAMFNTPKYLSRIGGPLTQQDPNALTKPNTFSIGDALANAAYNATPGRSVIGPAFGDTMYPSRAPAAANAALGATLGWHFSNKTPATDAILRIMQSGPYTQQQAARIYERYKR